MGVVVVVVDDDDDGDDDDDDDVFVFFGCCCCSLLLLLLLLLLFLCCDCHVWPYLLDGPCSVFPHESSDRWTSGSLRSSCALEFHSPWQGQSGRDVLFL